MSVCPSAGDCARQLVQALEAKQQGIEGQGIGVPLTPPMDLFRESNGTTWAVLEVPGAKRDQIDVRLDEQQGLLSITGRLERPQCERKDGQYLFRGARFGEFARELHLPRDIKEHEIKAHYDNGLLQVQIPEPKGSRGVHVQA